LSARLTAGGRQSLVVSRESSVVGNRRRAATLGDRERLRQTTIDAQA